MESEDDYIFQLTTSENEMNSINGDYDNTYNLSMIDLNECEDLLKTKNHLDKDIKLIILKFEKLINDSSKKNVQYEVYEPINKTKLDLSICQNTRIDIYIPIDLDDKIESLYNDLRQYGYDLFDINDPFYQDICTPYKSKNNTDVLLADRKNDYYNNYSETTCQANCSYSAYLSETKLLKCECNVHIEEQLELVRMEKFNGETIYKSFYDILKYSNYEVLKCYKLVFNINIFPDNYGNIIILGFFAIYFIFLMVFIIKGIYPLKIEAKQMLKKIQNNKMNKNESFHHLNKNNKNSKKKLNLKRQQKNKHNKKIKNKKGKNIYNVPSNLITEHKLNTPPKKEYLFKTNNKNKRKNKIDKLRIRDIPNKGKKSVDGKSFASEKLKQSINKFKIKDKLNFNNNSLKKKKILDDFELNQLEYGDAIKLDKRAFSTIYFF